MTQPLNLAHRGASAWAPENTLAAFQLAIELGADGFELDVQLSLDDEVVVIHDGSIDRTANGRGRVAGLTLSELKRFDVGSWFNEIHPRRANSEYQKESIPTLAEVLALAKQRKKTVYIELKLGRDSRPGIEARVIKLVEKFDLTQTVVIESFKGEAIKRVKELTPHLRTALLLARSLRQPSWPPRKLIAAAQAVNADELALDKTLVTRRVAQAASDAGLSIVVWTANSHLFLRRSLKLGVKGIITNYPDRLANLLALSIQPLPTKTDKI